MSRESLSFVACLENLSAERILWPLLGGRSLGSLGFPNPLTMARVRIQRRFMNERWSFDLPPSANESSVSAAADVLIANAMRENWSRATFACAFEGALP